MSMVDEKDFALDLIDAVKEFKCLYDKRSKDPIARDKAWSAVSMMCSETEEACKNKWKLLRDNFKKSYNRYMKKIAEVGKRASKPSWRYYEQLEFLVDVYTGKVSKSTTKKIKKPRSSEESMFDKAESKQSIIASSPIKSSHLSPEQPPAVDIRSQASQNNDTMMTSFQNCQPPTQMEYDSVADSFGNLVASKLKTFDPVTSEEAMKHIFNHLWSI